MVLEGTLGPGAPIAFARGFAGAPCTTTNYAGVEGDPGHRRQCLAGGFRPRSRSRQLRWRRAPNSRPPTKHAMKSPPPRACAAAKQAAASATIRTCAQCPTIHPDLCATRRSGWRFLGSTKPTVRSGRRRHRRGRQVRPGSRHFGTFGPQPQAERPLPRQPHLCNSVAFGGSYVF